jgi:16S rRNA processing protein RimM
MLLVVGHIGKAHGIRGEVLVTVRTDEPEQRFVPGAVFTTASGSLTLEALRWHQGRVIAQFEGVPDRNAAEDLRGTELQVDSSTLSAPDDPDEFNDHQLVGLRVVTVGGEELGSVARIDHAPSSDLLVMTKVGCGTALIPFVTAMVPTVDLACGRVVVDLPEGLLDL